MLKKYLLIIIVIALSVISTSAYSMAANPWPEFYSQAPEILIIDPMAMVVGSMPEGSNMITINLTDVAIYRVISVPAWLPDICLQKRP